MPLQELAALPGAALSPSFGGASTRDFGAGQAPMANFRLASAMICRIIFNLNGQPEIIHNESHQKYWISQSG